MATAFNRVVSRQFVYKIACGRPGQFSAEPHNKETRSRKVQSFNGAIFGRWKKSLIDTERMSVIQECCARKVGQLLTDYASETAKIQQNKTKQAMNELHQATHTLSIELICVCVRFWLQMHATSILINQIGKLFEQKTSNMHSASNGTLCVNVQLQLLRLRFIGTCTECTRSANNGFNWQARATLHFIAEREREKKSGNEQWRF